MTEVCTPTLISLSRKKISAMATLDKNYMTPAYYDIGRVFDIAGIASSFNTLHTGYNRDITSFYKSKEDKLQIDLDKMVEKYLALND